MPLTPDTRVARVDKGVVTNQRGSVVTHNEGEEAVVRWDDGKYGAVSEYNLVEFHKLKAAFKHGRKLRKTELKVLA